MDRCPTCPGACDRVVPRLCQLADPAHPDYNPAYRDWIAAGKPSTPGVGGTIAGGPIAGAPYVGTCCGDKADWTKLRGAR